MKNNIYRKKNSYSKIFEASFFATVLILTAMSPIFVFTTSVSAGDCNPPIAEANGPYSGYTGETINFDSTGSYDPDGVIILYEWDFDGDGTYDWSSGSTGMTTHSYSIYGTYTAVLRVTNDCGLIDTDSAPVTIYQENPPLDESCGIDIVLVLDGSGSINPDEYAQMQGAFVDFVNAFLPNTPTEMAIVEFATLSMIRQPFTSDATTLINEINEPRVSPGGQMTNWEQGLIDAHSLFPNRDKPDLIVFASDGDPTAHGPTGITSGDHLTPAVVVANLIKSEGIRIITLGIGTSVTSSNLIAISSADAYYDSDFETLADTLAQIAGELCGGSVIVRKWVDDVPAAGWEFTAIVTNGIATPPSGSTDIDGFIVFDIEIDEGEDYAIVDIIETPQAGYALLDAYANDCTGAPVGTQSGNSIINIPVYSLCAIYADFLNEEDTDDCPPTTNKTFSEPTYPAADYPNPDYGPDMGEHFWVTMCTEITLTAVDCPLENPSGIDYIFYEIWWDSNQDGVIDTGSDTKVADEIVYNDTVTFSFTEECLHLLIWGAVDLAGNEQVYSQYHRVDDTGPDQSITLGQPQLTDFYLHPNGNNYTVIGPNTPIYITSDDTYNDTKDCAVGSAFLTYVVNWGPEWNNWQYSRGPYTIYDGDPEDIDDTPGVITVVEYMPESCWHEIHVWCEDELGNEGIEFWRDFIVDADGPDSSYEYVGIEMWVNDEHYVHCSTIKIINTTDSGCIENGSGVQYIYWKVQKITSYTQVVTIAEGTVYDGDYSYYFDNGLVVVTGEYDPDYGEVEIEITVLEHCEHYIWYQAVDYVDNPGTYEKQKVRVDCKPPITTKTIGDPNYDMGYWVTTDTIIELDAVDQEEPCAVGVEEIHYRYGYDQDNSSEVEEDEFYPWIIVQGDHTEFNFTEECYHRLEWFAIDKFGNIETTHVQYHKVDNTPPNTTKTIGDPKYGEGGFWVTTSTLFELDAVDLPPGCEVGVDEICYRIGWDENQDEIFNESEFYGWNCDDGNHTEFTMPEECYHVIEWYAVDELGHMEDTHTQYHRVDDTPPVTVKTFNGPTCGPDDYYVTTQTTITLTATDYTDPCAVGVDYIYYEIWWDSDNNNVAYGDTLVEWDYVYDTQVTFNFTEECLHMIRWYAVDYLGNTEQINEQLHRVDDSPPETVKSFYGPTYGVDDYWVTMDTEITLTATDQTDPCAVGGVTLFYEIWWDSNNDDIVDTPVNVDVISQGDDYVTFKFLEECLHEIRWYSIDCLGNTETEHIQQHRVDDTPPTTTKTFEGPTYNDNYWLQDHGTTIKLNATDQTDPCAVGINYIHVELWISHNEGQTWEPVWIEEIYGTYYEFNITQDCYHKIVWWAVDYLGNMETENIQIHQVDSQPPVTTKTVNEPECQEGYYVTTNTLIELDAIDQEEPCAVGVEEIHYRIGWDENEDDQFDENEFDPWVIVPGDHAEFNFTEECYHKIEWFAVDYLTNTEQTHEQYHRVDDSPPITEKTFSGPVYMDNYWVTTDTEITLTATDQTDPCAVGDITLFYEVWWDSDNDDVVDTPVNVDVISQGDDYVTFKFLEECLHEIRWYSIDCLGNTETEHIQQHRVDDTPPTTTKTFEGPTYGENNYWLQDHGTTIKLNATDQTDPCAVGINYIHVELWWDNDGWVQIFSQDIYDSYFEFTIQEDCLHEIRWYAVDYLGNEETEHIQQHRVDSQPPTTTKTFDGPRCAASEEDIIKFNLTGDEIENFWLRDNDTWVIFNAVDHSDPCAVGVDYIHIELWNSTDEGETWDEVWIQNVSGDFYEFQIMEDCLHKIIWYAVDYLTNTEETHIQYHRVDSQPPESLKTFIGPTYPTEDYPDPWYGPDDGANYWVTSTTEITLTAEDREWPCDVGVVGFDVKVEWDPECDGSYDIVLFDDAVPEPYIYTFTFKELVDLYQGGDCYEGDYRITWAAYDCLGNTEEEKIQYHRVDDTGPHVVILKPTDGFYSDGSSIPAIILSEDIPNPHCGGCDCGAVGIEDGKQGYAYLIDVFPEFDIIPLNTTNLRYDEDSHEYIGNAVIPNPSGIPDGVVLFVAESRDNLENSWNSLFEILHAYFIQAMTDCGYDEPCFMNTFADLIADFIADQNIVWIGIDNTPPEVEITYANLEVGTIDLEVNATDVFSGIAPGTPCYVSIGGVTIGSLPYDVDIGGCAGTLSTAGVPDGEQILNVSVHDRAGCMGYDSISVYVPNLPGPTTSGTDVNPDPAIIDEDTPVVTATTFSTIAKVVDAEYFIDTIGNNGEGTPLYPVDGVWDETSEDIMASINISDMHGLYTIYVHGKDEDGRWGAYDEEEFAVLYEWEVREVILQIESPQDGDEFTVTCDGKYVEVVVNARYKDDYNYDDIDEINVNIWLDSPYGAPDLYYNDTSFSFDPIPVEWNEAEERFIAYVDIYKYHSGSELDIHAEAIDDSGWNEAEKDVSITVYTAIDYDIWLTEGWNGPINLAVLGCDDSIESVFASITGDYEIIFEMGTWLNYHYGHAGNTLHTIEPDAWYWIKMNNATRFYIDSNCPEITIDYPDDEEIFYNDCLEQDIGGYACDLETSVVEVVLTIYDDDAELYWNGTAWIPEETILPCIFDDETKQWYYDGTADIDYTYISGHTIILEATATDMGGCSCSDTIWYMFIDDNPPYVEITYPEDETTYDDCTEPSEIYGIAYDDECETIVTDVFIQLGDETASKYWDGDSWENDAANLSCTYNVNTEEWSYDGTLPEWTDGHEYSIYAMAYDAASNIGTDFIVFYYICQAGDCIPDKTWTTTADFNSGTHAGTYADDDQLMLETEGQTTYPTLWVANAGEDSLSKFDTSTNKEIARYHTWFGPLGNHGAWSGPAPSRTCVDADGNCYVANRDFDSYTPDVFKILTDDWIDRNGNGVLDTSYDADDNGEIEPDEMLPMTDSNSNGIIDDEEIVDERIAWAVQVGSGGRGRSLAIDLEGNIWLGLWDTSQYYKLSSVDGSILGGPYYVGPNNPYGALVDKHGYLWGADLGYDLLKLNTSDPTDYTVYYQPYTYGIALGYDSHDNTLVYCGGNCPYYVFNSSSELYHSPAAPIICDDGIATDSQGNIVAGDYSDGSVAKFAPDGSTIWYVAGQLNSHVRGIVVDADDNIWTVHLNDDKICKYDGTNGDPLGIYNVGHYPYTYSDATGIGYSSSVNSGKWTATHDSQVAGTIWNMVSWNSDEPEDTSITVKIRSSEDGMSWSPWETTTNGDPLDTTPDGRYAQIEVTMQSNTEVSPILFDISVDGTCANQNPNVYFEKVVYDDNISDWDNNTIVPIDSIVTFKLYIENIGDIDLEPFGWDSLPDGLEYNNGALVSYNGGGAVAHEPDVVVDIGWGTGYQWNLSTLQPGDFVTITFAAYIRTCGVWEENYGETHAYYGCCDDYVWDNDTAEVKGICEEECEIYATVTYPYNEVIDGEGPLTIEGTAYNDCDCPEIENVTLALYYTDYDDEFTPTYYWDDTADGGNGDWVPGTILYNPVDYVSGGCPNTTLNWTKTIDTTFYRPGAYEYYIHVAARPEDENAGDAQSRFTVGLDESDFINYWKLDGDLLDSIGSNDGTAGGNITPTAGILNQGYTFDGVEDYIDIDPVIGGLSDWTWCAWIYPTGWESLYSEGLAVEFDIFIDNNGNIRVSMYHSSHPGEWLIVSTSGNEIQFNQWNHLAISLSGGDVSTGILKIYVNGTEVKTATGQLVQSTFDAVIGYNIARKYGYFDPEPSYAGIMDEVAIFNKALSDEEIKQCFTNVYYGGLDYLGH